jgi:putative membrane protein
MKIMTLCCVVALAAIFSINCNYKADESTSNSGPDKTSLPNTPVPSNTMATVNSNMTNSNSNMGQDNFWSEAAIGGMAEVELGRLASTKAQNSEVKRFAEMMVSDHSKANEELKALAKKKNITLPTALDAEHQSTIQRLQGMSGTEFDRAYVDDMVEDHEADVQAFEKQSTDDSDPDAKAFAAKTLPTLQKHLDAIRAIQARLK